MEQPAQGSGHSSEIVRVQEVFGQHSQTYGLIFEWFFVEPGSGFDDPMGLFQCGIFCISMIFG